MPARKAEWNSERQAGKTWVALAWTSGAETFNFVLTQKSYTDLRGDSPARGPWYLPITCLKNLCTFA